MLDKIAAQRVELRTNSSELGGITRFGVVGVADRGVPVASDARVVRNASRSTPVTTWTSCLCATTPVQMHRAATAAEVCAHPTRIRGARCAWVWFEYGGPHSRSCMQSTDNQGGGGIELTPLPYDCRTCGTEQQVYVSPYVIDGERVVDAHNARLHHNYCDECDQERTMVLAVGEQIDAARDGAPVATTRDLHNQRTGGSE